MLRLLIVEDHALVREGLAQSLRQLGEGVEIFDVADWESAQRILEREGDFDLLLLDLGLPGVDGLTCLGLFRRRHPVTPVVILSAYDDGYTVARALKAGASGFVPKTYSSERLLDALRIVLSGQLFAPDSSGVGAAQPLPIVPPTGGSAEPADFGLTERQAQVLSLMIRGKSNRDVARELGLSEGTVKIHVTAVFKALGVSSRTQAMVAVAHYGIKL